MTKLSLRQAAEATGKSKSTISKALTSGKISYVSKDESGYQIEPSELFRVYPPKGVESVEEGHEETPVSTGGHPQNTPRNSLEIDILRELAEERKATIERLQRNLDKAEERLEQERKDAKEEREKARHDRESLMLWLEHKPADKTESVSDQKTQAPRRRWWNKKAKESKKDSVI